jgi:hypothetical protein
MLPPAPPIFSMMIGFPRDFSNAGWMILATVSGKVPAAFVITRIGLSGYCD